MKIVTSEQMRQLEQECARMGLPSSVLMENAGKAIAEEVRRILGALAQQNILCLIGPGNNGGDGLVAARHLHDLGARVSVYLTTERAGDANLEQIKKREISIITAPEDKDLKCFVDLLSGATAVIDALFGTGKVRPLTGVFQQTLTSVSQARQRNPSLKIIAVDLPSGLNTDTGAVDPATPQADFTITLGLSKVGLFAFPGAEKVGKLSIVDIGIPEHLAGSITTELMDDNLIRSLLPKRPLNANKGTFGKALVVAGSINYTGAAYLACSGALRVGAGLVTLATAASLLPVLAAKLTEPTYLPLPEARPGVISSEAAETINQQLSGFNVLLFGSGLGQAEPTVQFANYLLAQATLPALVLDADALNILTRSHNWWEQLPHKAILTPHPGEMSRLCGLPVAEIQAARLDIAKKFALQWQQVVVLKGAFTVIAAPDGQARISPFANPGLASGGTGDVLGGAIAGLLAQGLTSFDAAALGVYLHGKAGESVRDRLGDTGMLASDLLPELPLAIKRLKEMKTCC